MVDEERINELDAIDRRLTFKRRLTVVFFAVLSIALVMYAINIERKIQRLSESPAVVVYKNSTVEAAEDNTEAIVDNIPSSDEAITMPTSSYTTENIETSVAVDNITDSSTEEETQKSDGGQVYYVTASGKKYHKSGCSYLTSSKREIRADEISGSGYTPCSRCFK